MTGPATAPPRAVPAHAGRLLGRYELVRQLGSGGMGAVYEAVHRDLGKRAAIKTLHAQFASDPDVRARFLREGQAASRVRHPAVVDVYDVGIEGEEPYLVMELLEGESLAKLYKRETPLAPELAVDLLLPVAAAVAAAHDIGVIHRDLKPENVFLCRKRPGPSPKVLDFGISKLLGGDLSRELTSSAALLGTPYYMSPEQAQHIKRIDARTDQYSLAVILYEGLTATRPFGGDTLFTLLNAIVAGSCRPISELAPGVPAELEAAIARAMSTDPSGRFPDIRAFAVALLPFASERTRVLFSEEIEAPPSRPAFASPGGSAADALAPATATLQQAATSRSTREASAKLSAIAVFGVAFGVVGLSAGLVLAGRGGLRPEAPPASELRAVLPVESGVPAARVIDVLPAGSGAAAASAGMPSSSADTSGLPASSGTNATRLPPASRPVRQPMPAPQPTLAPPLPTP